jgi:hypothetical protein
MPRRKAALMNNPGNVRRRKSLPTQTFREAMWGEAERWRAIAKTAGRQDDIIELLGPISDAAFFGEAVEEGNAPDLAALSEIEPGDPIDIGHLAKLDDTEFFREMLGQIKQWRADKSSGTDESEWWMELIERIASGAVIIEDLSDRTRSILHGLRGSLIGPLIKPPRAVRAHT